MYHHKAMKQPDWAHFIQTMQKEMDDQTADSNFELVPQCSMCQVEGQTPATQTYPSLHGS